MFPFWIVLGAVTVLLAVFNRQTMRRLGLRPISEMITASALKHSTRSIEQIVRWLTIMLGIGFLVLGLGEALPNNISYTISFLLLVLSGLMLLAIIGITVANWRAK